MILKQIPRLLRFRSLQKKTIWRRNAWAPINISRVLSTQTTTRSDGKAKSVSPAKAYAELAKAKLSALVVTTTAAGFLSAGGPLATELDIFIGAVAGTALCSSSAAAYNQIFEAEKDQRMKRTQQRPLVTGALTPRQAHVAAGLWGTSGVGILYTMCDPVTAALGMGNIALYAGLYTYLKPVSYTNTWVGAVVGAIPPVMGYTAATNGVLFELEPLMLGSLLYLWQMPHFFALSFMHRVDYARGGFQMVPCLETDGKWTAQLVTRYTWYLSTVPFLATATGVTSSMFALEGVALNAYALTQAYKFKRERTNANARMVFLTSLWYLPTLLMLFLLHGRVWDDEETTDRDAFAKYLSEQVRKIRNRGRELCIHEMESMKKDEAACPVTVTRKRSIQALDDVSTTSNSNLQER